MKHARWLATVLLLAPSAVAGAPAANAASMPDCRAPGVTPPIARTSHAATFEDYPLMSRVLGEQGDTIVGYTVLANGTVGDVKVQNSSGSLRLDDASVAFVSRYLFTPATKAGAPFACHLLTQMSWRLHVSDQAIPVGGVSATLRPSKSDFPPGAAERNERGRVVAVIFADETGVIAGAVVMVQSAFADLNDATVTYLKSRKLKPLELDGKPAKSFLAVEVDWSPDGKPLDNNSNIHPSSPEQAQPGPKTGK